MTTFLTAVKCQHSSAEKGPLVQRNVNIPLHEIYNYSSLCLTIEKCGPASESTWVSLIPDPPGQDLAIAAVHWGQGTGES